MQTYFYVGVSIWFVSGFFGYLFALRGHWKIKPVDFGTAFIHGIFYGFFSFFLTRNILGKPQKKYYAHSKFIDSDYELNTVALNTAVVNSVSPTTLD